MTLELAASNAVVTAHQFNPSLIGQLWLVRNGLLEEEDFHAGCVFSDVVAQVNSRDFRLMVVPQQCQFTPTVEPEREQELVVSKVGTIVQTLPHTPFRAIGLNFTWHLKVEDSDIPMISRKLFCVKDGSIYREFVGEDSRFGAYMSKDAFGGRLKLDIKPVIVPKEDQPDEKIQFAFNFHRDVMSEADPASCIEQMLHQWDEARSESRRIANAAMSEELV